MTAVEFKGLTKSFGEFYANRNIDLKVSAGSIHAIIGENGAGKSTAMKMLYGLYRPDSGEIIVKGQRCQWGSPSDAISAGIGMVHQHFMLAEPCTVLENILLGAENERVGFLGKLTSGALTRIDRPGARKKLDALSAQYGLKVDWDAKVKDLSVGIHQRIEILKLLYRNADILILDEPTAVLTPQESAELFIQLRKMRDEGKTILIITHKLKEVMELAQEATVFRAGRVVGHRRTADSSVGDLAHLMVGREVELKPTRPSQNALGECALRVRNLTLQVGRAPDSKKILNDLNFEIRGGEILGIAGVEGNGQSELLQMLLQPGQFLGRAHGEIEILGSKSFSSAPSGDTCLSTLQIKALGVGAVPEDRLKEGLLLNQPVIESFLLGQERSSKYSKNGILNQTSIDAAMKNAISQYDVRPPDGTVWAGKLSGGNQQKVIVAREFSDSPKLLIVAQPTRGVDVGAIEFIHSQILEARSRGAAILLVSSELDEVLGLSDRILVFFAGEIRASFTSADADERKLGYVMGGAK